MAQTVKVLIVDDEPFLLNAVSSLLRGVGFEVHTCQQWVGVASIVRREQPDIVLLDYNMPSLRGDDICRALKRNAQNSDMKVLMFSSEPESDLRTIAHSCEADGYVCKDIPSAELVLRVQSAAGNLLSA
jgi:DNA-binding response OmpR family regulator